MAWFKTDDKLPDHRKARLVRKSHPRKRRDVAPFGIWVLAGAWSNDGFVPLEVLQDWDDDAEALAARLVKAGMWHPSSRAGEPGYVFHDWADQNPAKGDNDPSSSGTFGNHIRWHVQRHEVHEDCRHCPTEPDEESGVDRPDDRPDIAPMIAPDIANASGASLPSRPDPTRPEPDPATTTSSDKSDTTDRFDEFWDAYDKKRGRKAAEQKWRLALKKPGVTADMLIAAAASYIAWQRSEGGHPQYTKDASRWLNGEHWTDERVARAQPQTRVQEHLTLVQQLAAEEAAQQLPLPQIGYSR